MSAHTPGPWAVSYRTVLADVGNTMNVPIAETFLRDNREELSVAEKESNARLIAAAPELLAALEKFVRRDWFCAQCSDAGATNGKPASQNATDCPACEGGKRYMLEIERNRIARAAIAKARGGA